MATITAQEAQQIISADQRKLNQRTLPPTLDRIRVLMREETFPICNVGPWSYRPERGCLSTFIPAYDPQLHPKGYAESDRMPTIRREAKILDENEFTFFDDDGHQVALDLIGVGTGMHPMNSLVQYGVFVPKGLDPTPAEVEAARAQLTEYFQRLIAEARDAYDKGPDERKAVITDRHILAARTMGVDEKWVHHAHTQESVKCEMCGTFNAPGIAKCRACGDIIDVDLYRKLMARQAQINREIEGAEAPRSQRK